MRRRIDRLGSEEFDILVIGGGITGACVARDAARRGLSVALVEKDDFAQATSAANSKLIHGGLRYLRQFELGLVRESLKERRTWQCIAPHLVRPLPFLLPLYDAGWRERMTLGAGLTLYDLLSFDRAWIDQDDQKLPGHRWLDAKACVASEPVLAREGLSGAYLYYDCQMLSPERLALECLLDADAHGAAIANYACVQSLIERNGRIIGAKVRDGEVFEIRAKVTILALGPWADIFFEQALGRPAPKTLVRSKGIHIVTPPITGANALTLITAHDHLFVMPWAGRCMIGTTDTPYSGRPDDVAVTDSDIESLLKRATNLLPQARLTHASVEYAYAGLRPLVDDGGTDSYDKSRRSEFVDHAAQGLEGLFSILGGKWTTSRNIAEHAVDAAVKTIGSSAAPCSTASAVLPGGTIGTLASFTAAMKKRFGAVPSLDLLSRLYGARLPSALEDTERASVPASLAAFSVREEAALHLDDVMRRRTLFALTGKLDATTLKDAATTMATLLDWNEDRKQTEIADAQARLRYGA